MPKSATIYRLPTVHLPTELELLESTIEYLDVEHIELKGADPLSPANDKCQRGHMRVQNDNMKARFIIGIKPKRLHPFTRVFPCQVANISMGGVCIVTTKHLCADQPIVVYLSQQGVERIEEVAIGGMVIRRKLLSKGLFQYGIQFSATIPQGDLQKSICRKAIEKKVGQDPTNAN